MDRLGDDGGDGAGAQRPMWHVTLTVGGEPWTATEVRLALERLAAEQPFLLSARYAGDCAEVRYWEEASDLEDAAALALRLWAEHRESAGLPPWHPLALDVAEQQTYQRRGDRSGPRLVPAGGIRPF